MAKWPLRGKCLHLQLPVKYVPSVVIEQQENITALTLVMVARDSSEGVSERIISTHAVSVEVALSTKISGINVDTADLKSVSELG